MDNLEEKIYKKLQIFADNYFLPENKLRTGTHITHSVKSIVALIGVEEGFEVCVSDKTAEYHSEWLYDIVWYKSNCNKQLESIELVMETELQYGLNTIKYDFEKLLVANARRRIMLCLAGKLEVESIKNYFDSAIKGYSLLPTGEKITCFIWDDWTGDGSFCYHIAMK